MPDLERPLTPAARAVADDLVVGLVGTVVYGLLGLVLMSLSFLLIDALTPGKLGDELSSETLHPGTWVSAAAHVVIAVIMRPVGGWLSDRLGAIPVLASGYAVVVV